MNRHSIHTPNRLAALAASITVTTALAGFVALMTAPPAQAQPAATVAADLRMAQDSRAYRAGADAFIREAMAGNAGAAMALLSPALVERSGEAGIRRAMQQQILPFFSQGQGVAPRVTVSRTTDAVGHAGFAFYLWLEQADGLRPFTLYMVNEGGRIVVANVVPDRRVEGRHS
ncbi:MAG: hypothetical protein ACKVQR_03130 [Aquabacterium sp.]